ncbi:VP10 [Banna virus]|uniref:VP10 n=1 Tax=Banna virus TaxID=77763 RepID=W0G216_BANNV|nr:VP10 [Banna virus]
MDVLSKGSLRELLAHLEKTPLEEAISYRIGTVPYQNVLISRNEYYNQLYPDTTSLIDGVSREGQRNVNGLIMSIISYVVSGSGHYIPNIGFMLLRRSILDILTKHDTGLVTNNLNYGIIARNLTVSKMNYEQRKRMLICFKLLAYKDGNQNDYEIYLNQNIPLKQIAPNFIPGDMRTVIHNQDQLAIVGIPAYRLTQSTELSIRDDNAKSYKLGYVDWYNSNSFLRERSEFNLIRLKDRDTKYGKLNGW